MLEAVNRVGAKLYSGFVKSKPIRTLVENKVTKTTVDNITAGATIGSIVLKDGIGCGMYVYQSKHNKKIPEERRDFVWKLDAVNGGLMIAFQLLFFLGMRKFNDKLFYKAHPSFKPQFTKSFIEQARVDQAVFRVPETKAELGEKFADFRYGMISVFRSVTELVASTILAKRVVVPFIATYVTDKLEEKNKQKQALKQNSEPAMTGKVEQQNNVTLSTNLLEQFKQAQKSA